MITFNNVSKEFVDGTKAVDNLNFTIEKGETFVVIGPSGCGKTTTMKMINRLIDPSEGSIHINDKSITEGDIHKLRWNIGYVLQQIALFPNMTVAENISVVPEMKKWSKDKITARVDELLGLVGLDGNTYRDRMPRELSGGQQQRVGVARALAANPDILLMDEPFSALDPISREQLQEDVQHLQQTIQKTIVFVTHDMDEALKLGDRICIMKDGKVIQVGTPKELMTTPSDPFVTQFIGNRQIKKMESPNMIVRDVMNQNVNLINHPTLSTKHVIHPNKTIEEAYQQLKEGSAPYLLVKDDEDVVGTISYEDLARTWMKERDA
ncbi:ABC transporter ATP-binding protein [Alkalihalophilus sp. As8PL]|uniref:Quaternary amine transport ATP-binding protein n=1 Tax=Alkalihalophilus sp. As8PL TaxID=3237103 RepID=A0AB39BTX7_9BACI